MTMVLFFCACFFPFILWGFPSLLFLLFLLFLLETVVGEAQTGTSNEISELREKGTSDCYDELFLSEH